MNYVPIPRIAAVTLALGLALPATAFATTLNLTGTVTEADGAWAGQAGDAFTASLTFGLNEADAAAIETNDGSSGDNWIKRWFFVDGTNGSYGAQYSGALDALSTDTVWLETYNDLDFDSLGNPFGLSGVFDALGVFGTGIIADCAPEVVDPITGCPPGAAALDGSEYGVFIIGASNWMTDGTELPSLSQPLGTGFHVFGNGQRFAGGTQEASAQIDFNATVVPVPPAMAMMAGALGLLTLVRARRRG